MASNDTAQRVGIWIIAIVMTVGTLGSFAVIILQNNNQATDQASAQAAAAQQQADGLAQQKKAAQVNADNSEGFGGYSAQPFDPATATSLKVEVLKGGSGEAVKATDSINASYFGWTSDGKIFDSSKKKAAAADKPVTFPLSNVISGWGEGLTSVKVGSVVRLTIPADKAYGATGQGIIPANAPLQFVVIVNKIDNTPAPTK